MEKKYINAARELVWQWFLPAKTLTFIPETNEYRRYHLHHTHVQKAIKGVVRQANIPKRACLPIPSTTVLPATYYRLIMIFVPFRNCWDIVMCEPQ